MDRRFPVAAILIGLMTAGSASTASAAERARDFSTAVRFDIGASAQASVGGRVINSSARVGAGLAPPSAMMVARRTTVSAADGRLVPALVYDFE